MFLLLVFGHVMTMFVAVAAAYGPTILFWIARRTDETEPIRAVASVARPAALIAGALFGISGLLGLAAALSAGYDLLAPWLVISYVLFALLTFLGIAVSGPRTARIRRALAGAPPGRLAPDARPLVDDPVLRAVHVADFVLLIALVFDMVVKPFG
jgi:uncharacterized membrane protein